MRKIAKTTAQVVVLATVAAAGTLAAVEHGGPDGAMVACMAYAAVFVSAWRFITGNWF